MRLERLERLVRLQGIPNDISSSPLEVQGRVPASGLEVLLVPGPPSLEAPSFEALNETTLAAWCAKRVSAPLASMSACSLEVWMRVGRVTARRLSCRFMVGAEVRDVGSVIVAITQ